MSHCPRSRFCAVAGCYLAGIGLTLSATVLADEPAAEIDPQAETIVRRVAAHLAGFRAIGVDVTTSVSMDGFGIKMKSDTTQEVRVERPNKLAMITKASKGGLGSGMSLNIISNGDKMYISLPMMKRHMVIPAEKSLDAMSASPFAAMGGPAGSGLLISLMSDTPYEKIMEGVRSATCIGEADINGKKCHHLKFSQDEMDWELWIDTGENPLVRQVVPDLAKTIRQAGEQLGTADVFQKMKMTTITRFTNWDVNPTFTAADFKFVPPPGSVRVESMLEGIFDFAGENKGETIHPLVGKAAPVCNLNCLGKNTVDLADHKGKHTVVLEFWASWSEPCVKTLPIVASVAKEYIDKDVVLYAVNVEEDNESIRKFVSEQEIDVDILLDKTGKVSGLFQAEEIPQLVLIDKQGLVQAVHVGAIPNLSSQLRRDLDALLTGGDAASAVKATGEAADGGNAGQ